MQHDTKAQIVIKGARTHNLRNVNLSIPRDKLVVFTGLSGSGKSSLAFDTLYAEGKRRYMESLSIYARQVLEVLQKPDVDQIDGLSPAVAIEQKTISSNPRSTVGTSTDIYDHMRLLWARVGTPYSPTTNLPIQAHTIAQMVDRILALDEGEKIFILAPIIHHQSEKKAYYVKELEAFRRRGFARVRVDGTIYELDDPLLETCPKKRVEIVVDRLVVKPDMGTRLAQSLEKAVEVGAGTVYVAFADETKEKIVFSTSLVCPLSGFKLQALEPRAFSFNSPAGACPKCNGLGVQDTPDESLIINPAKTLNKGAIVPWGEHTPYPHYWRILEGLSKKYDFSLDQPWSELPEAVRSMLLYGEKKDEGSPTKKSDGEKSTLHTGVIPSLERRLAAHTGEELRRFTSEQLCRLCQGSRLKIEMLCVKILGQSIAEVARLSITRALAWFEHVQSATEELGPQKSTIMQPIVLEIVKRLHFLEDVGLGYLTLARTMNTLSGGEAQRIQLASQIGSGLIGVLYVLDEPSIGLHQYDNDRLLKTLIKLRDLGNTVVVVEHDEDAILTADHVVDMGPGAGTYGGYVVAEGTPAQIRANPNSLTGQYLSGQKSIPVPTKRREGNGSTLTLKGACGNNLRAVTLTIPLGAMTCFTGISGSGKSTLVIQTLYQALAKQLNGAHTQAAEYESLVGLNKLDKVIDIDQSPIGRTPRSNPATYTGAFTAIREWYANLPEAKARGYAEGRFSFNVRGGRCEACQGDGVMKIEMHFLSDVYVPCEVCKGKRYDRETLEVTYKNKSIYDVLDMTVDEAFDFFSTIPAIAQKMTVLQRVGLGYVKLGQASNTLSGGEAQRIKLSRELSRRSTGRTIYILDEPTTGLHFHDVAHLLSVLNELVEQGNTVVIIEHNLDVIKMADWVIDLGPKGGDQGGQIIAEGTPEQVAQVGHSYTGQFLKPILEKAKTLGSRQPV